MSRRNIPDEETLNTKNHTSDGASIAVRSPICFGSVGTMEMVNNKLRILRHYMLIPWHVRSLVTLFVVSFLSLLQGAREIKHMDALTSKDSVLNQVFVKMGWAWTLLSVITVIFVLLPISAEPLKDAGRAFARLLALTTVFYFWCAFVFPAVEQYTGLCLSKNVVISRRNKLKCIIGGHTFYSFDVSGHSFLMAYCTLTLTKEAEALRRYINMGHVIAVTERNGTPEPDEQQKQPVVNETVTITNAQIKREKIQNSPSKLNNEVDSRVNVSTTEAAKFRSTYMMIWPLICLCYVCLCLLCLTWDTVMVITTIYYHTLIEKVLGVTFGIASWAFLYQMLFVKLKLV